MSPSRRRLVAGALLASTCLLTAGPALADDIYDIDGRLEDAGLTDAYVDVLEAEPGRRITVDFDPGATVDRAGYEATAKRGAEQVWDHLETRVSVIDVQPTYGVPWLDGELPPTVSYTREDLQAGFGPRPAGLDVDRDPYDDDSGVSDVAVGIGVLVVLLVGLVVVLVVVLVVRRRPARHAVPYAAWGAPGGQQYGPPYGPQYGPAWGAPPPGPTGTVQGVPYGTQPLDPPQGAPVPPAAPPSFDPADPWKPPSR